MIASFNGAGQAYDLFFCQTRFVILIICLHSTVQQSLFAQSNFFHNIFFLFFYVILEMIIPKLFFPSLHEKHYFLFVVDMKGQTFNFLDSYYGEHSSYHRKIKRIMVRTN